jgi:hypothetical protein
MYGGLVTMPCTEDSAWIRAFASPLEHIAPGERTKYALRSGNSCATRGNQVRS